MNNKIAAKLNEEEMKMVTGGVTVNGEDIGGFDLNDNNDKDGSGKSESVIPQVDPSMPYKRSGGPKKPW
jgi:hypothetical protein